MRTTPVAASPLPLGGGAAYGPAEPGRGGCLMGVAPASGSDKPFKTAARGRGGCLKAARPPVEVA
jgi:hypothetical protein